MKKKAGTEANQDTPKFASNPEASRLWKEHDPAYTWISDTCDKINTEFLSHQVCSALLQQP